MNKSILENKSEALQLQIQEVVRKADGWESLTEEDEVIIERLIAEQRDFEEKLTESSLLPMLSEQFIGQKTDLEEGWTVRTGNMEIATCLPFEKAERMAEEFNKDSLEAITEIRRSEVSCVHANNNARDFRQSRGAIEKKFVRFLSEGYYTVQNLLLIDSFGTIGGRFQEGFLVPLVSANITRFNIVEEGHLATLRQYIYQMTKYSDTVFSAKVPATTQHRQTLSEKAMVGFFVVGNQEKVGLFKHFDSHLESLAFVRLLKAPVVIDLLNRRILED